MSVKTKTEEQLTTDELLAIFIKTYGELLYVNNPTREMCMGSTSQAHSHSACIESIKPTFGKLRYVKNPTKEQCMGSTSQAHRHSVSIETIQQKSGSYDHDHNQIYCDGLLDKEDE